MFDLNLQYIAQAERERRIESGLRRREMLQAASAAVAPDKGVQMRTAERREAVGPIRAFGR